MVFGLHKKKGGSPEGLSPFCASFDCFATGQKAGILLLADRLSGADSSAGTAADAQIGINLVLAVALRDGVDGALALTGTAADTSITNLESH